jgi:hypothetical protein
VKVAIAAPRRNEADESTADYAIWRVLHEPAVKIDGLRHGPYIACHERLFYDHRRRCAPLPSYHRGTISRALSEYLVPPVPRHFSSPIVPWIRSDATPKRKVNSCPRK